MMRHPPLIVALIIHALTFEIIGSLQVNDVSHTKILQSPHKTMRKSIGYKNVTSFLPTDKIFLDEVPFTMREILEKFKSIRERPQVEFNESYYDINDFLGKLALDSKFRLKLHDGVLNIYEIGKIMRAQKVSYISPSKIVLNGISHTIEKILRVYGGELLHKIKIEYKQEREYIYLDDNVIDVQKFYDIIFKSEPTYLFDFTTLLVNEVRASFYAILYHLTFVPNIEIEVSNHTMSITQFLKTYNTNFKGKIQILSKHVKLKVNRVIDIIVRYTVADSFTTNNVAINPYDALDSIQNVVGLKLWIPGPSITKITIKAYLETHARSENVTAFRYQLFSNEEILDKQTIYNMLITKGEIVFGNIKILSSLVEFDVKIIYKTVTYELDVFMKKFNTSDVFYRVIKDGKIFTLEEISELINKNNVKRVDSAQIDIARVVSEENLSDIFPQIESFGITYTPRDIIFILELQHPKDIKIYHKGIRYEIHQFIKAFIDIPTDFEILKNGVAIKPTDLGKEINMLQTPQFIQKFGVEVVVIKGRTYTRQDVLNAIIIYGHDLRILYNGLLYEPPFFKDLHSDNCPVFVVFKGDKPLDPKELITILDFSKLPEPVFPVVKHDGYIYSPEEIIAMIDNQDVEGIEYLQNGVRYPPDVFRNIYKSPNFQILNNNNPISPMQIDIIIDFDQKNSESSEEIKWFPNIVYKGITFTVTEIVDKIIEQNIRDIKILYAGIYYSPQKFIMKFGHTVPGEIQIWKNKKVIPPRLIPSIVDLLPSEYEPPVFPEIQFHGHKYSPEDVLRCITNQKPDNLYILHNEHRYTPEEFEEYFRGLYPVDFALYSGNQMLEPNDVTTIIDLEISNEIRAPLVHEHFPNVVFNGYVYSPDDIILLLLKQSPEDVSILYKGHEFTPEEFVHTFKTDFPRDFDILFGGVRVNPQDIPNILHLGSQETTDPSMEPESYFPYIIDNGKLYSPEDVISCLIHDHVLSKIKVLYKGKLFTPKQFLDRFENRLPRNFRMVNVNKIIRPEEIKNVVDFIVCESSIQLEVRDESFPNIVYNGIVYPPKYVVNCLINQKPDNVYILYHGQVYYPKQFKELFKGQMPKNFSILYCNEIVNPDDVPKLVDLESYGMLGTYQGIMFPNVIFNGHIYTPEEIVNALAMKHHPGITILYQGKEYTPQQCQEKFRGEIPREIQILYNKNPLEPEEIFDYVNLEILINHMPGGEFLPIYHNHTTYYSKDVIDAFIVQNSPRIKIIYHGQEFSPFDFKNMFGGNIPNDFSVLLNGVYVSPDKISKIVDLTRGKKPHPQTFPSLMINGTKYNPSYIIDILIEKHNPNIEIIHDGREFTPIEFKHQFSGESPEDFIIVINNTVIDPEDVPNVLGLYNPFKFRPHNSNEDLLSESESEEEHERPQFPHIINNGKVFSPIEIIDILATMHQPDFSILCRGTHYKPEQFLEKFGSQIPLDFEIFFNGNVVKPDRLKTLINFEINPHSDHMFPSVIHDGKIYSPEDILRGLQKLPNVTILYNHEQYSPNEFLNLGSIPADFVILQNGHQIAPEKVPDLVDLEISIDDGVLPFPYIKDRGTIYSPSEIIVALENQNVPNVLVEYKGTHFTPREFIDHFGEQRIPQEFNITIDHEYIKPDKLPHYVNLQNGMKIERVNSNSSFPYIIFNGNMYKPEDIIYALGTQNIPNCKIYHQGQSYIPKEFLELYEGNIPVDFQISINGEFVNPNDVPKFVDLSVGGYFSKPHIFPHIMSNGKLYSPEEVVLALAMENNPKCKILHNGVKYTPQMFRQKFGSNLPAEFEVFFNNRELTPEEISQLAKFELIKRSTPNPYYHPGGTTENYPSFDLNIRPSRNDNSYPSIYYNGKLYTPERVIKDLAEHNPSNVKVLYRGKTYSPREFLNKYYGRIPQTFKILVNGKVVDPEDVVPTVIILLETGIKNPPHPDENFPHVIHNGTTLSPQEMLNSLCMGNNPNIKIVHKGEILTPNQFKDNTLGTVTEFSVIVNNKVVHPSRVPHLITTPQEQTFTPRNSVDIDIVLDKSDEHPKFIDTESSESEEVFSTEDLSDSFKFKIPHTQLRPGTYPPNNNVQIDVDVEMPKNINHPSQEYNPHHIVPNETNIFIDISQESNKSKPYPGGSIHFPYERPKKHKKPKKNTTPHFVDSEIMLASSSHEMPGGSLIPEFHPKVTPPHENTVSIEINLPRNNSEYNKPGFVSNTPIWPIHQKPPYRENPSEVDISITKDFSVEIEKHPTTVTKPKRPKYTDVWFPGKITNKTTVPYPNQPIDVDINVSSGLPEFGPNKYYPRRPEKPIDVDINMSSSVPELGPNKYYPRRPEKPIDIDMNLSGSAPHIPKEKMFPDFGRNNHYPQRPKTPIDVDINLSGNGPQLSKEIMFPDFGRNNHHPQRPKTPIDIDVDLSGSGPHISKESMFPDFGRNNHHPQRPNTPIDIDVNLSGSGPHMPKESMFPDFGRNTHHPQRPKTPIDVNVDMPKELMFPDFERNKHYPLRPGKPIDVDINFVDDRPKIPKKIMYPDFGRRSTERPFEVDVNILNGMFPDFGRNKDYPRQPAKPIDIDINLSSNEPYNGEFPPPDFRGYKHNPKQPHKRPFKKPHYKIPNFKPGYKPDEMIFSSEFEYKKPINSFPKEVLPFNPFEEVGLPKFPPIQKHPKMPNLMQPPKSNGMIFYPEIKNPPYNIYPPFEKPISVDVNFTKNDGNNLMPPLEWMPKRPNGPYNPYFEKPTSIDIDVSNGFSTYPKELERNQFFPDISENLLSSEFNPNIKPSKKPNKPVVPPNSGSWELPGLLPDRKPIIKPYPKKEIEVEVVDDRNPLIEDVFPNLRCKGNHCPPQWIPTSIEKYPSKEYPTISNPINKRPKEPHTPPFYPKIIPPNNGQIDIDLFNEMKFVPSYPKLPFKHPINKPKIPTRPAHPKPFPSNNGQIDIDVDYPSYSREMEYFPSFPKLPTYPFKHPNNKPKQPTRPEYPKLMPPNNGQIDIDIDYSTNSKEMKNFPSYTKLPNYHFTHPPKKPKIQYPKILPPHMGQIDLPNNRPYRPKRPPPKHPKFKPQHPSIEGYPGILYPGKIPGETINYPSQQNNVPNWYPDNLPKLPNFYPNLPPYEPQMGVDVDVTDTRPEYYNPNDFKLFPEFNPNIPPKKQYQHPPRINPNHPKLPTFIYPPSISHPKRPHKNQTTQIPGGFNPDLESNSSELLSMEIDRSSTEQTPSSNYPHHTFPHITHNGTILRPEILIEMLAEKNPPHIKIFHEGKKYNPREFKQKCKKQKNVPEDFDVYSNGQHVTSADITTIINLPTRPFIDSTTDETMFFPDNTHGPGFTPLSFVNGLNNKFLPESHEAAPLLPLTKIPKMVDNDLVLSPEDIVEILARQNPPHVQVLHEGKKYLPRDFKRLFNGHVPKDYYVLSNGKPVRPENIGTVIDLSSQEVDSASNESVFFPDASHSGEIHPDDKPNYPHAFGNVPQIIDHPNISSNEELFPRPGVHHPQNTNDLMLSPDDIIKIISRQNPPHVQILHEGKKYYPRDFERIFNGKIPQDFYVLSNGKPVKPENIGTVVDLSINENSNSNEDIFFPDTKVNGTINTNAYVTQGPAKKSSLAPGDYGGFETTALPHIIHNGNIYSPGDIVVNLAISNPANLRISHEGHIFTPKNFIESFKGSIPHNFKLIDDKGVLEPEDMLSVIPEIKPDLSDNVFPHVFVGGINYEPKDILEALFEQNIACIEILYAGKVYSLHGFLELNAHNNPSNFVVLLSGEIIPPKAVLKLIHFNTFQRKSLARKSLIPHFTEAAYIREMEAFDPTIQISYLGELYYPPDFLGRFEHDIPDTYMVSYQGRLIRPTNFQNVIRMEKFKKVSPPPFPNVNYHGMEFTPRKVVEILVNQKPSNVQIMYTGQFFDPAKFLDVFHNDLPTNFVIIRNGFLLKSKKIPEIIDLMKDMTLRSSLRAEKFPYINFIGRIYKAKDVVEAMAHNNPANLKVLYRGVIYWPKDFIHFNPTMPEDILIVRDGQTLSTRDIPTLVELEYKKLPMGQEPLDFPDILSGDDIFTPQEVLQNIASKNPFLKILHNGQLYSANEFLTMNSDNVPTNFVIMKNGQLIKPEDITKIIKLDHHTSFKINSYGDWSSNAMRSIRSISRKFSSFF